MLRYTPRELSENVNVSRENPLLELLKLLGGALAAVVLCYVLLGFIVQGMLPFIPPAWEKGLDWAATAETSRYPNLPEAEKKLQPMLDKLTAGLDRKAFEYRIHALDTDQENAISFPAGHIVVYRGLIDATDEEEMAFVLAHELGHYHDRDHLRGLGRSLVFVLLANGLLGDVNGISQWLVRSGELTELEFSRQQELQADAFALALLHRAHLPLTGGIRFFEKMDRQEGGRHGADFLSTHPASLERKRALQRNLATHAYAR